MPGVKRRKSGCITCRIRRVRCDEAKPSCERCTSTGRRCDGYSSLPFSRRDLHAASQSSSSTRKSPSPDSVTYEQPGALSRLVTDPAFSDVLSKRYFQFFRHRTLHCTNSLVDSRFWDRTVLQACHTVPAIRHAVLALASWHQLSNSPLDTQHRDYADKQYQLALLEARQLIQSSNTDDIDKVLIACIVFICFEGVRGEYRAAQLHMDNGRNIAKQHAQRFRQSARRNDLTEIQHAMARLDLPAVTFSDTSSPYHYTLEDFQETDPCVTPWCFSSLGEARTCLVDLCRWMLIINSYLDRAVYSGDLARVVTLKSEKEKCGTRITMWKTSFDQLIQEEADQSSLLALMLRLWYHAANGMNQDENYGPETRYDALLEHFTAVVEIGEVIVTQLAATMAEDEISFSYDMGYTIIMFFAATRCRHPLIRRRAIAVLRAVNRQEGTWASLAAAAISERWMEIEEQGLGEIQLASDIPESSRVVLIQTSVLAAESRASLRFGIVTMEGEAAFKNTELVTWGKMPRASGEMKGGSESIQ